MQRPEPWRTERAADARLAFGRAIRALRRYHGWTQQVLETRSGLDQTVISRLETGAPIGMRFSRILDLLDAMGVDRIAFKTRWEGATVEGFMSRGRRDFDALGPERRWTGSRPSWADPEDPMDPLPDEDQDDKDDEEDEEDEAGDTRTATITPTSSAAEIAPDMPATCIRTRGTSATGRRREGPSVG